MFATSFTSIAVFGRELLLAEIQHTSAIITYCEQELAPKTGIQAGACSQHILEEQRFGKPKSLLFSASIFGEVNIRHLSNYRPTHFRSFLGYVWENF